jgi:glycosyltransferase involved in cell wall biosynthesis
MYYYSGLAYKILHFIEKIGWRMADVVLPISEAMVDYMKWEIPMTYKVVLDPVDPKDFPYEETENHGTVMFHGVLTKNKGIDILLEAAHKMPDTVFVIVGDGPDRARLESMAPDNVFFKGWVPFKDIRNEIAKCAVGVALRSDNPGNEYVVTSPFLQYGVMGKPCLVTSRKVFEGLYFKFSNSKEMVNHLKYLLKHPEEGEVLKKFVLRNHLAEKIAEEIWEILKSA